MGLGNNRDYKSTHKRAQRNLSTHAARMNDLVSQGMDREAASSQAYRELCAGELKAYRPPGTCPQVEKQAS